MHRRELTTLGAISVVAIAAFLFIRLPHATGGETSGFPTFVITCSFLEDEYEDNDSLGSASPITLPFNESDLHICLGDEDDFSFSAPVGKILNITVSFEHDNGDVDLRVYDPTYTVVASSIGNSDGAFIGNMPIATAGIHTIRINPTNDPDGFGNEYGLSIESDGPKALGDVNDDGDVNAIDSALILQLNAGLIPNLVNPGSADVNEDGSMNAIDAALVLQFVAGLIPSLPP
jgi:hypothetical protein